VSEIVYDTHSAGLANEIEPARDPLNASIPGAGPARRFRVLPDGDRRESIRHVVPARNVQDIFFTVENE